MICFNLLYFTEVVCASFVVNRIGFVVSMPSGMSAVRVQPSTRKYTTNHNRRIVNDRLLKNSLNDRLKTGLTTGNCQGPVVKPVLKERQGYDNFCLVVSLFLRVDT